MIGVDTTFLVQLELVELPAHKSAHELLHREILSPQVPLALAPQVLAEFIHVVTDSRRFRRPLTAASFFSAEPCRRERRPDGGRGKGDIFI